MNKQLSKWHDRGNLANKDSAFFFEWWADLANEQGPARTYDVRWFKRTCKKLRRAVAERERAEDEAFARYEAMHDAMFASFIAEQSGDPFP